MSYLFSGILSDVHKLHHITKTMQTEISRMNFFFPLSGNKMAQLYTISVHYFEALLNSESSQKTLTWNFPGRKLIRLFLRSIEGTGATWIYEE